MTKNLDSGKFKHNFFFRLLNNLNCVSNLSFCSELEVFTGTVRFWVVEIVFVISAFIRKHFNRKYATMKQEREEKQKRIFIE